ncbi:MAG: CHASE2 domain-containing protein [Cyanobacteriota bacterium]
MSLKVNIEKKSVFIPIVIFAIVVIVAQFNLLRALNNNIYDLFIHLNSSNDANNEITIVEIDQKSINKLSKWPWERKIYYEFLKKLSKYNPSVVAIYLNFSTQTDPENDQALLEGLKLLPTVVINPTFYLKDKEFLKEIKKVSAIGHDVITKDIDSIVRNQFLSLNFKPSFSLNTVSIFNPAKFKFKFTIDDKNNKPVFCFINRNFIALEGTKLIPVDYRHSNNKFRTVSFIDVLENKIPEEFLKNKIILVGYKVENQYESFITPLSKYQPKGSKGSVSPIMIQAQFIDSILHGSIIYKLNYLLTFILLLTFLVSVFNIFKNYNILKQLLIYLLLLPGSTLGLFFSLFCCNHIWIDPAEFILGYILIFIAAAISVITTTSSLLEKSFKDLSFKSDQKLDIDSSETLDNKFKHLIELVNIVHQDKNVLDTVLNSVNSQIMLFDKSGKIIYQNNSKHSKNINVIDEMHEDININNIVACLNETDTYKTGIIIKDNHYEFFSCLAKDGLYVGVLNDITDMVKMNEMKSNILRMLTHELKSPLAGIILCTESMRINKSEESINKFIDQISDQTDFIEKLVHDFLALSKLEITDYEINKEDIEQNSFINEILEELSILAGNKNISFALNFDNTISNIRADKKYFRIAVKNLIDNAIKYSPDDTQILITSKKQNAFIEFIVKDHGYGIPEKDLEKLFNKFYRVKTQVHQTAKGTGLGLSFVKRIIELHGGTIKINSVLNEGSEFILNIPVE